MVISPPTIGGEVFSYEVEIGGFITDYYLQLFGSRNNKTGIHTVDRERP